MFAEPTMQSQAATEAFFCMTNILMRNRKPLQDEENSEANFPWCWKRFTQIIEEQRWNHANNYRHASISPICDEVGGEQRWTEKNVHQQLLLFFLTVQWVNWYSGHFSKIVFIRLVFPDIIHNKEFLTRIPVKETTKCKIIYPQFVSLLQKQTFVFGNLCVLLPMGTQPWL